MTIYSDNLRIPHLDQNVAQPEIPENTAKDIIDQILSGRFTTDFITDADITITHSDSTTSASDWQNAILNFTSSVALTGTRNVILPDNQRVYIIENNTGYSIQFKTLNGTGVTLVDGNNVFCYSDGVDIIRLDFIATGLGTTLESLQDTSTGYGNSGQALISDGIGSYTLEDLVADIGLSSDVTPGYGSNGQVLVTNGVDFFSYADISTNFIGLTDVDETGYQPGDAGKAVVVNQAEDGLEFGIAGITLEGPNEITDESGTAYGTIFTGDAAINFSTDVTTGTGLMYGTQGLVGINTNIEFFKVDPTNNVTELLGANTEVTHADASVTTLNNPEWIAQNAQRTADLALKNSLDVNLIVETLSKAATLTHDGVTTAFTFNI